MKKQFIQQGKKLGLAGAALVVFVNQAMAAVDTTVTTGLSDTLADVKVIGAAVFLITLAIFAYKKFGKAAS